MNPYGSFLIYLLAILGFAALTLWLNKVVGPKPAPTPLKLEPFECGATPVQAGKILDRRAKDQVLEGLEGLLSLMPSKVRIVDEAFPEGRFVAADRLLAGDLFRVAENEIVAADGVVVSGSGTSDESSVTGEPRPVAKKPGDSIRSGSRLHHGSVTICANQVGAESTLGQMIAVVQNTLMLKTPGGGRTEKILQRFVPSILLLAAATGGGVWLRGLGVDEAVLRAVTVTVIACPCAFKFKRNEIFIPEMLLIAKAMHEALAILKPKLVEVGAEPAGKAVIGTVSALAGYAVGLIFRVPTAP